MNQKKIFVLISILVLTIAIIAGSSFAYFELVIDNSNPADAVINSKELIVEYQDGPQINIQDALPGATFVKTFSVTNKGNDTATYSLYFIDVNNEFHYRNDITYTLTSTNNGGSVNQATYPISDSSIIENISIPKNVVQEYTLTIHYLNREFDQTIDSGKKITGTISLIRDDKTFNITGKAINTDGTLITSGYVELHSNVQRAEIASDGSFSFSNVEIGEHTISFFDNQNVLIKSQIFNLYAAAENKINNNEVLVKNTDNSVNLIFSMNSTAVEIKPLSEIYNLDINSNITPSKTSIALYEGVRSEKISFAESEVPYELYSINCTNNQVGIYENGYFYIDKPTANTTCEILFNILYPVGYSWTYNYTGQLKQFYTPRAGNYKLEVWGAQGGSTQNAVGGFGGYATGEKKLIPSEALYLGVGGTNTTFNGAYSLSWSNSKYSFRGAGGGGATHIGYTNAQISGTPIEKLLLVAGGGGGAAQLVADGNLYVNRGGAGGGTNGGDGEAHHPDYIGLRIGYGGTQSAGGNSWNYSSYPVTRYADYGIGAVGNTNSMYGGGAGGGGLYGGGAGYQAGSGGGGSGYLGNVENGSMISGEHTGNGLIKITLLSTE